jgi:hypothetical protein
VLDSATPPPVAWQRLSQPPTVFVRRPTADSPPAVPVAGAGDGALQ